MKFDINNNPLEIGDTVVYAISLGTNIFKATIVKLTKKLVYLKAENGYTAQRYSSKICKIR